MLASMVFAFLWCAGFVLLSKPRAPRTWRALGLPIAWGIYGAAVMLQLLSWRLVSFASVTRSGVWSTHADPVFFALSQTVAGKTLLVDLPSQYGLFPEMLAPVFKIIGLSVFSLSACFAAMQVVSMGALYFVMSRLLKSRVLLLVAGLALVLLTFETVLFFVNIDERYFQYWPLRFFWPAMSVLAFATFSHRPTLWGSAVVSLIAAVALLWNVDSGLFVLIAFGAFLVARIGVSFFCRVADDAAPQGCWKLQKYAAALAIHVLVACCVVGGSFAVMTLRSGQSLNLLALFEYQRVFVVLGLMMLPLPRELHPWMSVLAVYLGGLLISMDAWRRAGAALKADVIFYLSMLGLGLFVYYSGRAHVLNLVTVCWPALLVTVIVADQILRCVRAGVVSRAQLALPVAGLALALVMAASFAARAPLLFGHTLAQFESRGRVEEAFVASELTLIKTFAMPKSECLILSQRQGIYYAETGLVSPMRGPGLVEILLKSDAQRQRDELLSGRFACVFLGVGPYTDPGLKVDLASLFLVYEVAASNPEGTLLYLRPKLAASGKGL